MKTKITIVWLSFVASMILSTAAPAAGGGDLMQANVNVRDTAALQRGARLYVNYCFACHAAGYMRYNRLAEDLGLSEEMVMENLMFADAKIGDTMDIAMRPDDAEAWLGKTPPDLSLIARSRGVDWLYTYMMTFYQDETGDWNNQALPNASMPHVLWQLQGIQKPVYANHDGEEVIEKLVIEQPGLQTPEEYQGTVRDLVAFLEYVAEPAKLKRKNVGIWVLLFLALFTLVAYALKDEYWRDVH